MTDQDLVDQTMANFKAGDSKYPQIIGIDDLLAAVILAVIGGTVSWMTQRCLHHEFDQAKVRRLVRWSCKGATDTPQAKQLGINAAGLDHQYGDRITAAVTMTYNQLGPEGVKQVRATHFLTEGV